MVAPKIFLIGLAEDKPVASSTIKSASHIEYLESAMDSNTSASLHPEQQQFEALDPHPSSQSTDGIHQTATVLVDKIGLWL